jgi:hypothetical protein
MLFNELKKNPKHTEGKILYFKGRQYLFSCKKTNYISSEKYFRILDLVKCFYPCNISSSEVTQTLTPTNIWTFLSLILFSSASYLLNLSIALSGIHSQISHNFVSFSDVFIPFTPLSKSLEVLLLQEEPSSPTRTLPTYRTSVCWFSLSSLLPRNLETD